MHAPEVIILAGGFGTRLRGVIQDLPKPLAPVAGRPFLTWLLDKLQQDGVPRVILATGYLSHLVEQTLGTHWRGMPLHYSVETEPLGTGGAIKQALSQTSGGPVVVINGDTWLRFDPKAFTSAVLSSGLGLGLALAHVPDVGRYGAVTLEHGRISEFGEKNASGQGFINAGVYCLAKPNELPFPADQNFSFEKTILAPMAAAGQIAAFTDTGDFIDIGIPEDFARAQEVASGWLT